MRVAIIGLGNIGKVHAQIIVGQKEDLVAVCDIDANKTKDCDCLVYNDYKRLIDEVKLDVVHICTPHYLHSEMIRYALEKNVNVLCEKPLCIKKEDIPKILEAEKKSKAILGVCHQNRYNQANLFVKDYLKNKEIVGGWGAVVWKRTADYYSQDDWHGKKEKEGGGAFINQALHTIDLLAWLIGQPQYVTAFTSNFSLKGKIEVEDTAVATYSGKGNFTILASNCGSDDFPVNITIKTKNHIITIVDKNVLIDNKQTILENPISCYGKKCYGAGHRSLISDFYYCVKNNIKFSIDGEEASKVVQLILGAYLSNGETVKI